MVYLYVNCVRVYTQINVSQSTKPELHYHIFLCMGGENADLKAWDLQMILTTEMFVLCHVFLWSDISQFKTKPSPFVNHFSAFVTSFFFSKRSCLQMVKCSVNQVGTVTRLYTTRTQNWNWTLYSLQSHCRIEYPDGVVFEETCVEYCCPASSWGQNLGSALEG